MDFFFSAIIIVVYLLVLLLLAGQRKGKHMKEIAEKWFWQRLKEKKNLWFIYWKVIYFTGSPKTWNLHADLQKNICFVELSCIHCLFENWKTSIFVSNCLLSISNDDWAKNRISLYSLVHVDVDVVVAVFFFLCIILNDRFIHFINVAHRIIMFFYTREWCLALVTKATQLKRMENIKWKQIVLIASNAN